MWPKFVEGYMVPHPRRQYSSLVQSLIFVYALF